MNQIEQTAQAFATSSANEKAKDNELFARMKLDMIKAHIECVRFQLMIDQVNGRKFKDPRVKEILLDMYRIAAWASLIKNCSDVFETGYFAPQAVKMIKLASDKLIAKVRPQLIPIVEACQLLEVASNIGNKYGDCYEMQLEQAKNSKLNKLDKEGVPPQWESHIKPLLHGTPYPKL